MPLDLTKPVQTRSGKPARILCIDAKGAFPVIALVDDGPAELPMLLNCDGRYHPAADNNPNDLINLPERRTVWLNVYPRDSTQIHVIGGYCSKEEAKAGASYNCIACVPIEIELPPQD